MLGVVMACLIAATAARYVAGGRRQPVILQKAVFTERDALPAPTLDLNTATAEELEALPGIGPTLAGRIVEWRQAHGAFRSAEDVMSVRGIGEATYAQIEPYIRFD